MIGAFRCKDHAQDSYRTAADKESQLSTSIRLVFMYVAACLFLILSVMQSLAMEAFYGTMLMDRQYRCNQIVIMVFQVPVQFRI
ncbi:hypothetical protein M5689_017440 [Euphorbia peplus]|nr:hypothetical protein M5689_017440 [Euphorbia peplus]